MKPEITQAEVAEILSYCPDTGVFTWRVNRGGRKAAKAGDVAGSIHNKGYRVIGFSGRLNLAHRLAFLFMEGAMPAGDVDHKNGIRDDNRWSNLRDVSRTLNQQNQRKARSDNETGLLGVSPHRGRFKAQIRVNGRVRTLGIFDCPHVAHAAYVAAKRLLHEGCTL